jgi:hypothetical protein
VLSDNPKEKQQLQRVCVLSDNPKEQRQVSSLFACMVPVVCVVG